MIMDFESSSGCRDDRQCARIGRLVSQGPVPESGKIIYDGPPNGGYGVDDPGVVTPIVLCRRNEVGDIEWTEVPGPVGRDDVTSHWPA